MSAWSLRNSLNNFDLHETNNANESNVIGQELTRCKTSSSATATAAVFSAKSTTTVKSSKIIHKLAIVHVHSQDQPLIDCETVKTANKSNTRIMTSQPNSKIIRADSIISSSNNNNNDRPLLGPLQTRRLSLLKNNNNSTDGDSGGGSLESNSLILNHPPRLSLANKNSYNLTNPNENGNSSNIGSRNEPKRRFSVAPEFPEYAASKSTARPSLSIISQNSNPNLVPSPLALSNNNHTSKNNSYLNKIMVRKASDLISKNSSVSKQGPPATATSGAIASAINNTALTAASALTLNNSTSSPHTSDSDNNLRKKMFTRTSSILIAPNSSINNSTDQNVQNVIIGNNNKLLKLKSLDIFNMGKIQEFRDKVSGGQISMTQRDIWKCLAAEFLGTFLLVFIGCGSTIKVGSNQPSTVEVALCFGLTVATLIVMIGHVSGCHVNPAVTLAMLVTGKIKFVKAGLYIVVQCVGSIVAIAVLKALSPLDAQKEEIGYVKLTNTVTPLQGVCIEFLITFVLVFVIFGVCDEQRNDVKGSGALAIGLALTGVILYGGPVTGAGINPARVFGPCVIIGKFEDHWVYWLGPVGGAIVAAAIYQHVFRALRPDEIEAAEILRDKKIRELEANKEHVNNISNSPPPV